MTDWVKDVNNLREPSEVAFPERLARVHNDFERIHPFLDGNGRTGRLLLNLLLVRLGYPPAIVFKNERAKYLDAMRKADRGEDGPLGELIARAVTNNLYRFVVPCGGRSRTSRSFGKPGKREVGSDRDSPSRGSGARCRLRAQKSENGTWLSSKNWVADYQKNKHKRGGSPTTGIVREPTLGITERLGFGQCGDDPSRKIGRSAVRPRAWPPNHCRSAALRRLWCRAMAGEDSVLLGLGGCSCRRHSGAGPLPRRGL